MAWGFRKSFKLAPGIRLTAGKRGVGLSAGPTGRESERQHFRPEGLRPVSRRTLLAPESMRPILAIATVVASMALLLTLAMPAGAAVTRVSFTAVVSPSDYALLTVRVKPRARCTIKVVYDTVVSKAKGLGSKTGTTITWRWKVGRQRILVAGRSRSTAAGAGSCRSGCACCGTSRARPRSRAASALTML